MKIEKINDNQIRCTLYRQDLENHQIRLSELAYGTEKAKQLFRDMIQQAHIKFGFEADNIPLMIEAIPISTESLVLIITKVEDPDELDTRFSKFAPFRENGRTEPLQIDGADNILDLLEKLREGKARMDEIRKEATANPEAGEEEETVPAELIRLFSFSSLDHVIGASHSLGAFPVGENTLYRDSRTGSYLLVLHQGDASPEEFNKINNILSEYGDGRAFTAAGEAYLKEHEELITSGALQVLSEI